MLAYEMLHIIVLFELAILFVDYNFCVLNLKFNINIIFITNYSFNER